MRMISRPRPGRTYCAGSRSRLKHPDHDHESWSNLIGITEFDLQFSNIYSRTKSRHVLMVGYG